MVSLFLGCSSSFEAAAVNPRHSVLLQWKLQSIWVWAAISRTAEQPTNQSVENSPRQSWFQLASFPGHQFFLCWFCTSASCPPHRRLHYGRGQQMRLATNCWALALHLQRQRIPESCPTCFRTHIILSLGARPAACSCWRQQECLQGGSMGSGKQMAGGTALQSSGSPLTIKLPRGTRGSSRGKSVMPTPSPPFREGPSSAPHADTQSITEGRYLSMLKIHINESVKGFHLK